MPLVRKKYQTAIYNRNSELGIGKKSIGAPFIIRLYRVAPKPLARWQFLLVLIRYWVNGLAVLRPVTTWPLGWRRSDRPLQGRLQINQPINSAPFTVADNDTIQANLIAN